MFSGSLELFHKSMSPQHEFLILVDVQVRFGKTLFWILAVSLSIKLHVHDHDILATVLRILSTVPICVNSSIDADLNFHVSTILTVTILPSKDVKMGACF